MRFRRPLKDVEVRERDVAVLECEVPDESVQAAWYLEDQRLMPSSKYGMEQKGTRRRLTIRDVAADDDGVYFCEMPDGAKSIAELTVKGRTSYALIQVRCVRKTKFWLEFNLTLNGAHSLFMSLKFINSILQGLLFVNFRGSWRSWRVRTESSVWRWTMMTWRSTGSRMV